MADKCDKILNKDGDKANKEVKKDKVVDAANENFVKVKSSAKKKATKLPKAQASNKKERSKKKRAKKDPNAPKRPASVYMLWLNEIRASIAKPGMRVGDVAKIAGEMWKKVEDRTKWELLAELDKDRYEEEMIEYKRTGLPAPSSVKKPKASSKKNGNTSEGAVATDDSGESAEAENGDENNEAKNAGARVTRKRPAKMENVPEGSAVAHDDGGGKKAKNEKMKMSEKPSGSSKIPKPSENVAVVATVGANDNEKKVGKKEKAEKMKKSKPTVLD